MKSLGVSRRLDNLGRYVIPAEIRKNLDIKEKDILEVYTEGNKIVLKKVQESCTFCGNKDELQEINDKYVCKNCVKKLWEVMNNGNKTNKNETEEF